MPGKKYNLNYLPDKSHILTGIVVVFGCNGY
jgi:hypothetical protein